MRRLVCASACVFHINNIALPFSVFRVSATHITSFFLTPKFARNLFTPTVKVKFSIWTPWKYMGSGSIAPLIPKFGTTVSFVFSVTPEKMSPFLPVHIEQKAGLASDSVWTLSRRENSVPLLGMDPWFLHCPAVPSSLQWIRCTGQFIWQM